MLAAYKSPSGFLGLTPINSHFIDVLTNLGSSIPRKDPKMTIQEIRFRLEEILKSSYDQTYNPVYLLSSLRVDLTILASLLLHQELEEDDQ